MTASTRRAPCRLRWRRLRLDLDDNFSGRQLLAFDDIDGGNGARDRSGMHVLHFHGFQRHYRLAGPKILPLFDQNRHDTAVHRGANLALTAGGGSRRSRRGQSQIADRKCYAAVQDIKPIAVAEESCRFHDAVDAETDGVAAELVDLEPALAAIEASDITAVTLTHDFEIMDAVIELNARGHWKR